MKLPVTDNGERPAGKPGFCFYCGRPIGGHAADCVCVTQSVVLRMTITYIVAVPADWSKDDIEFHRNEGSFCMDNDIDKLYKWTEQQPNPGPCSCNAAHVEFVREATQADHEDMIDLVNL